MKTSSTKETVCRIGNASIFIVLLAAIGVLVFGLMTCLWADMKHLSFATSCGIGICIAYILHKYFPDIAWMRNIWKIRKKLEGIDFYRFMLGFWIGVIGCNTINSFLVMAYPEKYAILHIVNILINTVLFYFLNEYDLEEE